MTGRIFAVKKLAVHDGDGIRTTFFFKGCPLSCVWCHNPEGISFKSEIQYIQNKCLNCGECTNVCKYGVNNLKNGIHSFERELCRACGECERVCIGNALALCGKNMTTDEIMEIVMEDRDFYECSGGGVTLSGGECLCQADFCAELLKKLKAENINCNVDTCGYVEKEAIDKVMPYTDLFLYDIKHINSELHKKYTGVPNEKIIENLLYINSQGKPIEVRIPLIPSINDDEETLHKIGKLLSELHMVKKVRILQYNNLVDSKYKITGRVNKMPQVAPPPEQKINQAMGIMNSYGLTV